MTLLSQNYHLDPTSPLIGSVAVSRELSILWHGRPAISAMVVGDFNALRQSVKDASYELRAKDLAVRSIAQLPKRVGLVRSVAEMNKRRAMPLLESYGFTDATDLKHDQQLQRIDHFSELIMFYITHV